MRPDTIVCWKWTPAPGYRSTFGPDTVNTLRAMVARHYPHPHRFLCVTDNAEGLDPRVEILQDFGDFADLPSPHGGKNPSCYRRLRLFHPEAAQWFGARFVSMDLDCVIARDVTPLWDRPEDFVMWGDTNPRTTFNGSMVLMTAGARSQVWERFDPATSPAQAKASGCWGSDQGWISFVLGKGETRWNRADGVYSFRNDIQRDMRRLPSDARIVFFHGSQDPWGSYAQTNCPWVREHYC